MKDDPTTDRPRMFGGKPEPVTLPWSWAVARLEEAANYWIATTRPDGRPHTRPVWGVWLDGALYFSTGSLAARNLPANHEITVHLDSGNEVVILEGHARLAEGDLTRRVVALYNDKYNWDLDPENLPGPFYQVVPRVGFGWVSDDTGLDRASLFLGSATRWRFPTRPEGAG